MKSKQPEKTSKKQQIEQIADKQQEVAQKKEPLLLQEKKEASGEKRIDEPEVKKDDGGNLRTTNKEENKKEVIEAKPITVLPAEETQKAEEVTEIKMRKSPDKSREDLKKADDGKDEGCKIEKVEKVRDEEEPLPEIKEGTMEIADCDDPRYKTLHIFMDKNADIFGPDKWQIGQPKVGTMKKISNEEFTSKIGEIKARYGAVANAEEGTEINWNELFQAKSIKREGDVLILTLPVEIARKVKRKRKRKKK
ncbi:unnamed protein product [Litomosoides sigmodontis]|uniref:Uncharacterized protein n=1 Tax=Litomosoides sigmodontis TaxID=42156 RepID=A0A3P6TKX5_LITSI|nr:unnamed protein product [Litomosoides sigmodontis]